MNIKSIIAYLYIILLSCFILSCSSAVEKKTEIKENPPAENIKEDDNESGNPVTDVQNPESYFGEYDLHISNFKATLRIYEANGKFHGEITFEKWGNGLPQALKYLNISGSKIYFIRSISTADEMKKYGSSRFFRQQFHGTFSDDQKKIKGYYLEAGAESSWWAVKK